MNKAIFLDRDGVINEMWYDQEHGLVDSPANPEQFKLKEGIEEFIKTLQGRSYLVIMISNQPGIAKKKYTKVLFNQIRKKMRSLLSNQGVFLDGEYYCLHHPEAADPKYKVVCRCRKPKPGLILKAAKEHDINLKQSWMIGDGIRDVQVGKAAGCRTILLANITQTEYLRLMEKYLGSPAPDFIVRDFDEALKIIS